MSTEVDLDPPANHAVTITTANGRGTALVPQPSFEPGTSVTIYDKIDNVIQFLGGMSDSMFQSGVFKGAPKALCDIIALECMARKQTPLQLAQTFHVFDGKLSMRADAILAEFNRLGGTHVIIARTPERAEIELKWNKKATLFSFTWEEAQKEPYVYDKTGVNLKVNWATPRSRMQLLWARVVSDGVRAVCPRVNSGRYTPEEIADFDDTPRQVQVTHQPPQQPAQVSLPKNTVTTPPVIVPGSKAAETATTKPAAVVQEASSSSVVPSSTVATAPQGENDGVIDAEFTVTTDEKTVAPATAEPPFEVSPLVESDEVVRARTIDTLSTIKKELNIVKADWLKLLSRYGAGIDSAKKLTTAQLGDFYSVLRPGYEQFKGTKELAGWLDKVLGEAVPGK